MIKITIPEYVRRVMAEISALKTTLDGELRRGEVYAVGGCVRDALLGKTPNDWDVTTNLPAETVLEHFTSVDGFSAYPTGLQHGTVTVVKDSMPVEVTTFRTESAYADHRHPTVVSFVHNLGEDLKRRDFTVNAMAYSDNHGVIDLYGGRDDLKAGIIRCVGDPSMRFGEDSLRILRALRFAAVLDFEIEEQTAKTATYMCDCMKYVSPERITAELSKLLSGKAATRILCDFAPIIGEIFPTLTKEEILYGGEYVGRLCEASFPLSLAALISEIDTQRISTAFLRLRLDNKTKNRITDILTRLHQPLDTRANIKRLMRDVGTDCAKDVIRLGIARFEREERLLRELDSICENGECYSTELLEITGGDLLALGAEPKTIGAVLSRLLELVIEEKIKNTGDALAFCARQMINRKETT